MYVDGFSFYVARISLAADVPWGYYAKTSTTLRRIVPIGDSSSVGFYDPGYIV